MEIKITGKNAAQCGFAGTAQPCNADDFTAFYLHGNIVRKMNFRADMFKRKQSITYRRKNFGIAV